MNCDKFNECLDNYENLSDETKQKMDKHALECANCKSELEFMRSIISTAKSLPDINVPVDFMEKLNVRIDEEEKKKARITRRVMRNVRRNWKQYTAAMKPQYTVSNYGEHYALHVLLFVLFSFPLHLCGHLISP